jgi:4-hydroxy-tetrahydrodipicolinate synthase
MKKRLTFGDLTGILPAIPTPTTSDDVVDDAQVHKLVAYLRNGGVRGLVPLGGTGEYCSLSRAQRVRMVEACARASGDDLPVVAGVLDPGFHDALDAGRAFADAGADGLLVLTPYYTNPTQAGIRDYFLRYADNAPLPVVLYEIPYRTRIAIQPEVIHELSRHENIIGIKACNTDMHHFLKLVAGVSNEFSVLGGEDALFPLHMAAGARGGIIVTASVIPKTWMEMYRLGFAGEHSRALAAHRQLLPFLDYSFAETNPGPLKSVWDIIGIDAPHVLAPLVVASSSLEAQLRAELSARLLCESALP